MSFLALLEILNFSFSKFEPFPKSFIYQNSNFRVSKVVKKAIFEIQILQKLISHKIGIGWHAMAIKFLNFHTVGLTFTFFKFLEHSAVVLRLTLTKIA